MPKLFCSNFCLSVTIISHKRIHNFPRHSVSLLLLSACYRWRNYWKIERELRIESLYMVLHAEIEPNPSHLTEVYIWGVLYAGKRKRTRKLGLLLCRDRSQWGGVLFCNRKSVTVGWPWSFTVLTPGLLSTSLIQWSVLLLSGCHASAAVFFLTW